jgi:hypothetical protein
VAVPDDGGLRPIHGVEFLKDAAHVRANGLDGHGMRSEIWRLESPSPSADSTVVSVAVNWANLHPMDR